MVDSANNTVKIETADMPDHARDQDQVEKFMGFATRDGERLPAQTSVPQVPGKTAKDDTKADDQPADMNDGDDDGNDGNDGNDDDQPQRHKSAQARINKAVGKQRAAERELAAAKARLDALEARMNNPQGQQQQGDNKPAAGKEPNPAEYEHGEFDSKYVSDLVDFRVQQSLAQQNQNQRQQQQTAEQTAEQEKFMAAKDDFMTRGLDIADDFEDVLTDDSVNIWPTLVDLAFESEHGPAIMYEAMSDPKEAKKLSAMSPARQAAWFGTQEAKRSSASSGAEDSGDDTLPQNQSSQMTTQAPEPMKGKARGNGKAQPTTADTNDFRAFEQMASQQ